MTFYSLTKDAEGHWIATCDRCSSEIRTPKPHADLSMAGLALLLDQLDAHFNTHSADTRVDHAAPLEDVGDDDDVEPLPGALAEESDGW